MNVCGVLRKEWKVEACFAKESVCSFATMSLRADIHAKVISLEVCARGLIVSLAT